MTAARTALVIGGGIAGPVLAMALRRAGIEATVYEAYATGADGVGGTLTVAPNGLDALRIVGADRDVRAVGRPIDHTVMADGRGRELIAFPGLHGLEPSQALWRPDLYRALHDRAAAAGIAIEHGRRLVAVDEAPDGITARFADGTTATADVLVGADGIRSTVRALIDPDAPGPRHVPLLNAGGWADVAPPTRPDAANFVFGRRAFLGWWLDRDAGTAWFANVPDPEPLTAALARAIAPADWLARLAELFAGERPAAELVARTPPERFFALGSVETMPPVPRWSRGRMVLVGDAVHAPSPSSGQGASLAIESAVELARSLRDAPDVAGAFASYERLRRGRVERVAKQAAKTNRTKGFGRVATRMMGLTMPLALRTVLTPERMLGADQRHRIDWDAPALA
jgi:2-polyprenyl-6-methoxyphenol hydroxylase-like FAD-dependent oxidoreductase